MNTDVDMTNIMVLQYPIEANYGEWAVDHPECDTVCEQIGASPTILIYAYATSKKGNSPLHMFRDKNLAGKDILKGVSMDGIRKLI